MISQPTMDQLMKMMAYCNEYSFVIPSYNLKIPEQIVVSDYRPEKVFRLLRSGFMSYSGTGGQPQSKFPNVYIGGIKLEQPWIDRAYIALRTKIEEKIKTKANNSRLSRTRELLLKFNDLEFLVNKTS
jgi:hypothetical protein